MFRSVPGPIKELEDELPWTNVLQPDLRSTTSHWDKVQLVAGNGATELGVVHRRRSTTSYPNFYND